MADESDTDKRELKTAAEFMKFFIKLTKKHQEK